MIKDYQNFKVLSTKKYLNTANDYIGVEVEHLFFGKGIIVKAKDNLDNTGYMLLIQFGEEYLTINFTNII
ncbi:MAG: hypothetical protein EBR82_69490 [Caulobacteraceae bacterium]|nr:hypothetical protein [Caulobacteraceae bacterium]